jgi:outer membrane protein insertion porin family
MKLRRLALAIAATTVMLCTVVSAQPQDPPTPATAPTGSDDSTVKLQGRIIETIQFNGNRKVEDDAVKATLTSKVGDQLDASKLREDVRAIWKLGRFADVSIEAEVSATGAVIVTYLLVEKPSVRKIQIAGNDQLDLEDLNKALGEQDGGGLELDKPIDIGRIKIARAKLTETYIQKGYYLASVTFEIRPVNEAESDIIFTITERSKVQIRDVQFVGNSQVTDDELRSVVGTKRPGALSVMDDSGTFNQKAFERDLLIISAYYWDRGFANVKVGTPQVRMSRDKAYMYLSIPIDEGPVFTIGKIEFKGDLIGTAAEQLDRLRIRPGAKFGRTLIGQDREALASYYMDQGYAYANISPLTKVDIDKREIALTFEISRGRKAYFERINIRGNSKTRDKVIRREMKIAEGELFNNTNLDVSKRRIAALGFFKCPEDKEPVTVSTKRGSSDEFVEVNVEVCETSTGTFQIGAGFSSVENFIAQAQVSQNNLFGRGQTLALQAQLSSLRQLFLLRFVEPYFLDTDWTFAFDLYNQSRGFGNFARNSSGGSLTWGYPLSYEARAFLTYKLETVKITTGSSGFVSLGATRAPITGQSVANLFRGGVTSSLRGSLQYDTRNNRLEATQGWFLNGFAEYAGVGTISENRFVRVGGFARYYRPLWGPFVLKQNLELGLTTSRDPLGVPISERYLIGGIFDVRGYAPRSLGPRISTSPPGDVGQGLGSLPLGGNLQIISNTEIVFPLFKRIGISGVVFFDMGNAYNLESRYCSGLQRKSSIVSIKFDPCFRPAESLTVGLRKSLGFGFRWNSPIGPLRFEWGIPLDRQAQISEDPLVFEFTIGNFF